MDLKGLASRVKEVNKAGEVFLEHYEAEMTELLKRKDLTAEESLLREIIVELTGHLYGIRHITEYLEKTGYRNGTIERNRNGEIEFNGEVLPLMTELEVYVRDAFTDQEVWTRVFVGGAEKKYLVGLKKNHEIQGIPARMRE